MSVHKNAFSKTKWTIESILEDAKKYKTKAEWRKNSGGAYIAAHKKQIVDLACAHMEVLWKKKWTEEAILKDAKKYNTRSEWEKNSVSAYCAANRTGLMDKATAHMEVLWEKKWTEEAILEDAKKYRTRSEWKTKSGSAYGAALRLNLLTKACAHMTLQMEHNKWTEEAILKDAKKYNSIAEWRKNSSAYGAAIKKGLLNKATGHMARWVHPITKWTTSAILEDAKKYKTKIEWIQNSSSAYSLACERGLLEKATSHMKRVGGTSKPEQNILALVKQHYPKAQVLRDRNVSIPDKSHITGFEIDIYIPELRKGIEFNGKYWHSLQGLKRGRTNWPEHDLKNYHLIKTEHFKKKGIEILHIDEKEWLKSQDKCIVKIKQFIGIN